MFNKYAACALAILAVWGANLLAIAPASAFPEGGSGTITTDRERVWPNRGAFVIRNFEAVPTVFNQPFWSWSSDTPQRPLAPTGTWLECTVLPNIPELGTIDWVGICVGYPAWDRKQARDEKPMREFFKGLAATGTGAFISAVTPGLGFTTSLCADRFRLGDDRLYVVIHIRDGKHSGIWILGFLQVWATTSDIRLSDHLGLSISPCYLAERTSEEYELWMYANGAGGSAVNRDRLRHNLECGRKPRIRLEATLCGKCRTTHSPNDECMPPPWCGRCLTKHYTWVECAAAPVCGRCGQVHYPSVACALPAPAPAPPAPTSVACNACGLVHQGPCVVCGQCGKVHRQGTPCVTTPAPPAPAPPVACTYCGLTHQGACTPCGRCGFVHLSGVVCPKRLTIEVTGGDAAISLMLEDANKKPVWDRPIGYANFPRMFPATPGTWYVQVYDNGISRDLWFRVDVPVDAKGVILRIRLNR